MPFDNPPQSFGDVERLLAVRDRISNADDWLQGGFKDGNRHCLVGALSLACASRSFYAPSRTERRLARVLAKQIPPTAPVWMRLGVVASRHRLMAFNDIAQTTHEDVLALLDRAISQVASEAPAFVSA